MNYEFRFLNDRFPSATPQQPPSGCGFSAYATATADKAAALMEIGQYRLSAKNRQTAIGNQKWSDQRER